MYALSLFPPPPGLRPVRWPCPSAPPPLASGLLGGMLYALSPGSLSDRCVMMSYGLNSSQVAEAADPAHLRFSGPEGVEYCWHRFCLLIERGRVVGVDEVVERDFVLQASNIRAVNFQLYATDRRSAR